MKRSEYMYGEYCRVMGQESPITPFEKLPELWRDAWESTAKAAVIHWLETEFKPALKDKDYVLQNASAYMAVARDKKLPPHECVQMGVGAFVLSLVNPEEMEQAPIKTKRSEV